MAAAFQAPYLLQLPVRSPQLRIVLSGECPVLLPFRISGLPSLHRGRRVSVKVRTLDVVRCLTKSTVEPEQEGLVDREISGDDSKVDPQEVLAEAAAQKEFSSASVGQRKVVAGDSLSLGIREPVYEVPNVISILMYLRILSFNL
nr:magnesium transporter MRS2-11, chloroplastic-like [Ipomoea trifida]